MRATNIKAEKLHTLGGEDALERQRGQQEARKEPAFERWSHAITRASGSARAFLAAVLVIVVWGVTGPLFHFSDTWQLVINTGTTIVTFLMVFLIQQTQNKDSLAIQLKLNELVAALGGASNRLINVEGLSQRDLQILHEHYARLAEMAKEAADIGESHSVDEAERRHRRKHEDAPSTRRDR